MIEILKRKIEEQRQLRAQCRKICADNEFVYAYAEQVLTEVLRETEASHDCT